MQLMGQSFWSAMSHQTAAINDQLCFFVLLGFILLQTGQPSYDGVLPAPTFPQLQFVVVAEALSSRRFKSPVSLSSWLSSASNASSSYTVPPVLSSSLYLSADESIGEGVMFFVMPDGNIDSREDANSTSLIEYLLRGYLEKHVSFPPQTPPILNESVADASITRRRAATVLKNLHSPLEPENHNAVPLSSENPVERMGDPPSDISPKTLRAAVPPPSAPQRSLAPDVYQDSGLPHISSYHYMTPQRARTGWSAAVAPYGLDGGYSGASAPLVSALGGMVTDVPAPLAYAATATSKRINAKEPRLSGLQIAAREYTDQMDEVDGASSVPTKSLQGALGNLLQVGGPLVGNLASALTAALTGIISPSSGISPFAALPSLIATASNGLRLTDNNLLASSRRLADIFPHAPRESGNREVLGSTDTIAALASSVGLIGRALLPPLLEMAGPLVSEVGQLVLQQAAPIGSEIVQSIVRQTGQAINTGDPALGHAVEGVVTMVEEFLRPLLESTIQRQIRTELSPGLRNQLIEDINEVMRSNLGNLAQSFRGVLRKELPPQLRESMDATMATAVQQSVSRALDESMPLHVGEMSREVATKIQQEVRALLNDPSTFLSADSTQALLKEISRGTTRSVSSLLQGVQESIAETMAGESERRQFRAPTNSDSTTGHEALEVAKAQRLRRQLEREEEVERPRRSRQLNGRQIVEKIVRDEQRETAQVRPVMSDVENNLSKWLKEPGDQRQDSTPTVSDEASWERLTRLYRRTANEALSRFSLEQQRKPVGQTRQASSAPSVELPTYEKAMLDAHNKYRKNAGIRLVKWDQTLADFIVDHMKSQDAWKNCKMEHSKQAKRDRVGVFTNIGENLYTGWGGSVFPKAERIVEAWYNEIHCYRYGPVGAPCTKNPNAQCARIAGFHGKNPLTGHFTQLMWSTATHVGCGAIECASYRGGGKKFFGGCSYGSSLTGYGGNMVGEYPFDARVAGRLGLTTDICS
eukprot:GHVS01082162.1.p1 GENE.GHVS01082162.1~~GHVS01082162.1.p1  ORF type:complete len:987 (+),score=106.86 GHVS01082162.1:103-3063(+)